MGTNEREVTYMGTINYQTGEIITLGLNMDFELDTEYINEMIEDMGYEEDDAIETFKSLYVDDAKEECRKIINNMLEDIDGEYIDVHIENGYYEGFCVVVNKKYLTNKELDDQLEREEIPKFLHDLWKLTKDDEREIINELRGAKIYLNRLINWIDVCYPSWCTKFETSRFSNLRAIDTAIEEAIEKL